MNPQLLADYVAEETGGGHTLSVSSEGAIIEALRFGHADIAFMDGGSAWMGWKEYGLAAMAADMKSDGRTYYDAHAVVLNGSDMAMHTSMETIRQIRSHFSKEDLLPHRMVEVRWNALADGLPDL